MLAGAAVFAAAIALTLAVVKRPPAQVSAS
jgi:hypothetical protein